MIEQIKTKRYWSRVAGYFVWFLVTYTIIQAVFPDEEGSFWTLPKIQERSGFAFFMSLVFAYRHGEQSGSVVADSETSMRKKWTLKDFLTIYGLMFLFSMIIMSVLFLIGCVVMVIVNDKVDSIGINYLRMVGLSAVMVLFVVLVMYLSDRFRIRWGR